MQVLACGIVLIDLALIVLGVVTHALVARRPAKASL